MSPSRFVAITSISQPARCSSPSLRTIAARSLRNAMLATRISPRPEAEPPSEQSISSMRSTIVSSTSRVAWKRGEVKIVFGPASGATMKWSSERTCACRSAKYALYAS